MSKRACHLIAQDADPQTSSSARNYFAFTTEVY